jgi:SH3-like domain-containing protein
VTGRCHEGWCPVVQGRFDGWMHKDQLAPMSAAVYCVGRVDAGWTLDIHEGPSRSTRIVASLHDSYCGISLTPFKQGHWIRVKAAGAYGWVSETNIR